MNVQQVMAIDGGVNVIRILSLEFHKLAGVSAMVMAKACLYVYE